MVQTRNFFHFGTNLKKWVPHHAPEHLFFRCIVLRGVIWHTFLEFWAKVKHFLQCLAKIWIDCLLEMDITYHNQWKKWQWEVTDRICRLSFYFSICKKTKNNTFKFYSNVIGSIKWHFVKNRQSSSSIPELSVLSAPQRRGVCCYSCSVSNIKLVLWLRFWLTLKFNYKWKGWWCGNDSRSELHQWSQ